MARRGEHNTTILQFSERSMSALRVKPSKSGLEVVASAQESGIWSVDDGSLGTALDEFVSKHGLSGDRIYTVLPRHEVTVRMLELPTQDEDEISGMVRLTAEEILPFPIEELVTTHCVLEELDGGNAKVMAVVVHEKRVQSHLTLLNAAGIKPVQVYMSSACLLAALSTVSPSSDDCFALVNVSVGTLEMLVMSGHGMEYGRGIALGSNWSGEGELSGAARSELVQELRTALGTHRRESPTGTGPERIYISSDSSDVDGLCKVLGEELDVPCLPGTPYLNCVQEGREQIEGVPLIAIGAAVFALGRTESVAGLLPESEIKLRAARTLRASLVQGAVAAALVLVSLIGVFMLVVVQRKAYIAELDARAEVLRPQVRNIVAKRKHLERLQAQLERDDTVLELLARICELAPSEGLNITRFQFDHGNSISINGRVRDPRFFAKLLDDLRAETNTTTLLFSKAQEIYRREARERNQDIWGYSISIPFPTDADETSDE